MKHLFKLFLFLCLSLPLCSTAQQINITSMHLDTSGTETVTRKDFNGNLCVLLKIKSPMKCEFAGNIVGDTPRNADGYNVYVTGATPMTKMIVVSPAGSLPIDMVFSDYGVNEIVPGQVYIVEVNQGNAQVASYDDLTAMEQQLGQKDIDEYSVDLGLSVRWATMNVGATKPSDVGDFFAWGETQPKDRSEYDFDKSPGGNMDAKQLRRAGVTVVGNKLAPQYDAATVNWGRGWRMPKKTEVDELRLNCKWKYINVDGRDCFEITGPNGNKIILPFVDSCIVPKRKGEYFLDDWDKESPSIYYWTGQPTLADYADEYDNSHKSAIMYVFILDEEYGFEEQSTLYPNGDANRGTGIPVRAVAPMND